MEETSKDTMENTSNNTMGKTTYQDIKATLGGALDTYGHNRDVTSITRENKPSLDSFYNSSPNKNNKGEEHNDKDSKSIVRAATTCLKEFNSITMQADPSTTSYKHEKIAVKLTVGIRELIEDMERSFTIWVNHTGALVANTSQSLETRLQGYEDIRNMILELLEMLSRNLKYCMCQTQSF